MGWQPIESAPKDGERKRLWVPCGKWHTGYYVTEGCYDGQWQDDSGPIHPTRWMPLSEPYEAQK